MSSASVLAIDRGTSRGADLPQARLEHVFGEEHSVVWRMLRRFGLSAERAADATQWVFGHVADQLGQCAPGSERVLLLGCALRLLDAYRQAESRHVNSADRRPLRAEPGHSGVVHAAPLRATSAPSDMMDRVLLRMTRASATVFFLFELEGLSLAQSAQVMGVDEESALGTLEQARQEFRAIAAELHEAMRRE